MGAPPSADPDPFVLLAAAAAAWAEIGPALPEPVRTRLEAELGLLRQAEPGGQDHRAAASAASRTLRDWLGGGSARLTTATAPPGYLAEDLVVLVLDGHRMVGPVLGAVRERLLAEPALDCATVRAVHGTDPQRPDLVRLRGAGGRTLLPRFQFRDAGEPWAAVLEVNTLLDAQRDPWGVADWWLSPNAWVGAAPCRLLGSGRDPQVVAAARYLTEGE